MLQIVTECALAEPKFGSILHITSSNPIFKSNQYVHSCVGLVYGYTWTAFPFASRCIPQCRFVSSGGGSWLCFRADWTGIQFHNRPRCSAGHNGVVFFPHLFCFRHELPINNPKGVTELWSQSSEDDAQNMIMCIFWNIFNWGVPCKRKARFHSHYLNNPGFIDLFESDRIVQRHGTQQRVGTSVSLVRRQHLTVSS